MQKPDQTSFIHPMVSVCTPTFNRRPFIPAMLELSLIHISEPTRPY